MLKRVIIASSLALSLAIPNILWAKNNCDCMTGSMTQCQSAMDQMMMDKLGKKDSQYDKRFIDLMISHHESGVMMAKDALKNSTHPELKEMSQKIIEAQEKEIEQLKKWRSEWYGSEQQPKGE
ncbi:DUF305 domain-containing protein [Legionella drancourtii]|nr:DUF305 domain-containing protein [Legionella drancourtii]